VYGCFLNSRTQDRTNLDLYMQIAIRMDRLVDSWKFGVSLCVLQVATS